MECPRGGGPEEGCVKCMLCEQPGDGPPVENHRKGGKAWKKAKYGSLKQEQPVMRVLKTAFQNFLTGASFAPWY